MSEPQCACYVYRTGDAMREDVMDEISFCPLHAAAPELLKALKDFVYHGRDKMYPIMTASLLHDQAIAAIKKATEGRE